MASEKQLKWRPVDPVLVAKGDFVCLQMPGKNPTYHTVCSIQYATQVSMYYVTFDDGRTMLIGSHENCLMKFC